MIDEFRVFFYGTFTLTAVVRLEHGGYLGMSVLAFGRKRSEARSTSVIHIARHENDNIIRRVQV